MTMHHTLSSSVRINPSREELQRDAIQNKEGKLSQDKGLKKLILEKKYDFIEVNLSNGVTIDFDTIEDFN